MSYHPTQLVSQISQFFHMNTDDSDAVINYYFMDAPEDAIKSFIWACLGIWWSHGVRSSQDRAQDKTFWKMIWWNNVSMRDLTRVHWYEWCLDFDLNVDWRYLVEEKVVQFISLTCRQLSKEIVEKGFFFHSDTRINLCICFWSRHYYCLSD